MHIEPIKKTVGGHTGEAVYVQLHIRLSHFERFPLFGRFRSNSQKEKNMASGAGVYDPHNFGGL